MQEQAARAKTHAKEEAEKGEPKVSVSDPEARAMRLADGAVAPGVERASGDRQWLCRGDRSDRSAQGPRFGAGDWSRRLPSAVAGCRDGCWPIPQR